MHMTEESLYLLTILKSFIQKESPGAFQGDWKSLIHLAHIHSVTGILGYMVMKYPDETNAQAAGIMRQQCLQTIAVQANRTERMRQLIRRMEERQIDHLMFKGYILKDYYPVPELRTYGDIDFLIRTADRKKSDALMMELGFERKTDWEPVYSYYKGMEYYEIHTDVMEVDASDRADYRGYFGHVWEHAHATDGHTWELEPEYHFLYLLTHIAKHISGSGAGIRMYLDIAVFIKHFEDRLDWEYVRKELKTLRLEKFSNAVLTVVQRYLGMSSPIPLKKIDDQIMEEFMEFTFDGGVFGHAGRDAGLISLKSQARSAERFSRLETICRRMFPGAESLEKRYTYLQGRHWLLPVAWLHRLFKTRGSWDSHTKEMQSILNTDEEKVLKLKRIYREIGL